MILIGTSGFSYKDWKGEFYPPNITQGEMLPFYACNFSVVELNFSYYRMPDPSTLGRMVEKTGGDLIFTIKAHKDITHGRRAGPEVFTRFSEALLPLRESSTLGCVLAQFPWSFSYGPSSMEYLESLAENFQGIPVVVEFRQVRWIRDEVFELLRRSGLGFCCVDQPRLKGLVPPTVKATSPVGYVRFHGRNAARWWDHDHAHERYDYLYSREELAEWVPRIRELARKTEKTFVFTNNHFEAKAVTNARMLTEMLEAAGGEDPGDKD
jgi:uncharacterized protein YecE (DUF72 family)